MRHFLRLYTQSICALPRCVMNCTLESALVTPAGFSYRVQPALGGTPRRAINIAAVARQAELRLHAAVGTIKQTKAGIAQSLSRTTGQQRLDR
jgi:hypothetical protein